jgi:hypothetical protein
MPVKARSPFQTAEPALIFENIFSNLSPGYLWNFARFVCRSWNECISCYIVRAVLSKGLVQMVIRSPWTEFEGWDEKLESVIYRCSRFDRGYFTFVPWEGCEPYATPFWGIGKMRTEMDWDVVDIASSMFPYEQSLHSGGYWRTQRGSFALSRAEGDMAIEAYIRPTDPQSYHCKMIIDRPMSSHTNPFSQMSIGERVWRKRSRSGPLPNDASTEGQDPTETKWVVMIGSFTLYCRFRTLLSGGEAKPAPAGGDEEARDEKQEGQLEISSVQISLNDLLRWTCRCVPDPFTRATVSNPCFRGCPVECLLGKSYAERIGRGPLKNRLNACDYLGSLRSSFTVIKDGVWEDYEGDLGLDAYRLPNE